MRKIIVSTFISMDGVVQAPGGPQEDPTGGFIWGGWTSPHGTEQMMQVLMKFFQQPFYLLLGRRTYEIFAAYWPYNANNPIGEKFNSVQKFVVASTSPNLSWDNSTLITGDVVAELKKLKHQDGPNLLVQGSRKLIQTLLQHNLIDELHTWIYPVTFGKGKKLFEEGTTAAGWALTNSTVSTTGVIIATYVPAGDVKVGTIPSADISEAEKNRQETMAKGEW